MTNAFLPSYTSARHLALRHVEEHPGQTLEDAVAPSVAEHLLQAGLIETVDGKKSRDPSRVAVHLTDEGRSALKGWSALYAPVRPDPIDVVSDPNAY